MDKFSNSTILKGQAQRRLDPGIIQLAFNRKNARSQNESAGGGSYRVLSLSLNLFRLFLFSINRPAREDPVNEAALAA